MQLTHVRMLVSDVGAAKRFYGETLGLGVGADHGTYVEFRSGGASIAVFARTEQQEAVELRAPGDGPLPVLVVDSVDDAAERVREHLVGGPLDRKDWGGRVAYVRDPDGNLLELFQDIGMDHDA